ncbi:MAG: hypothetical protein WC586_05670 [Methanoregula sp.]
MGIIEDINRCVINTTYDEALSSLLKNVMNSQISEDPMPKNYFYVTHVTNPAQTYFSRFHPEVKKTPEIARKLARGKQLHNFASIWFKNLPDFCTEEGLLDGVWAGIPGVRGKIDHRIGDSLIEFKTKEEPPNTPDDIVSKYPQDLEQIAFYSVMHPSKPNKNYLVFMRDSAPYKIKAFRIDIKDIGTLKSVLISRIDLLNKAIETKDPSKLGRCRYFETGCQFHIHGLCSCAGMEPLNIAPLLRSLEITYDKDFTHNLIRARDASEVPRVFCVSTRDIITPRKHYMDIVSGLESPYNSDDVDEYKACLWASVSILKREHSIDVDGTERQSIMAAQRDPRARVAFRWMKIKSSLKPEGEIVPYIEKVSLANEMKYTKPSQYHLAELGIICAMYGKSKGLIIRVFPNMDKYVQVVHVSYKNQDEIVRKVKSIIDSTEEAEKNGDLASLPLCPTYMNDGGRCPLTSQCCANGSKGCK